MTPKPLKKMVLIGVARFGAWSGMLSFEEIEPCPVRNRSGVRIWAEVPKEK